VIYTRLISIFRKPFSITIIFPLTLRLYKQVPPTSLWIYDSLSPWSAYKRAPPEDWLREGDEILERATEEQYTKKGEETATEATRRQNTLLRQEKAGEVLRALVQEKPGAVDEEKRAVEVEKVKTLVLAEEMDKWDEREAKRRVIEEEERERLVAARRARGGVLAGDEVWEFMDVYGLTGVGVVIGIAAFAGAIIAVMNSSR
jgi:hypothetical protein